MEAASYGCYREEDEEDVAAAPSWRSPCGAHYDVAVACSKKNYWCLPDLPVLQLLHDASSPSSTAAAPCQISFRAGLSPR